MEDDADDDGQDDRDEPEDGENARLSGPPAEETEKPEDLADGLDGGHLTSPPGIRRRLGGCRPATRSRRPRSRPRGRRQSGGRRIRPACAFRRLSLIHISEPTRRTPI